MNLVNNETYNKITNESISVEEKETISKIVAVAALKYADLLPYRGTDYIFELEKFADLEGKTGSYILYSTIRMKSLLAKAKDLKQEKMSLINGDTEREIALTILSMPTVLTKAKEAKSLNDIAEFLYKLTSLYNKFYSENKVLVEENKQLQESWLVLTKLVYDINNVLLDVLGLKVPEKM